MKIVKRKLTPQELFKCWLFNSDDERDNIEITVNQLYKNGFISFSEYWQFNNHLRKYYNIRNS